MVTYGDTDGSGMDGGQWSPAQCPPPTGHPPLCQGRHCPTLAGMARVETPVSFAHLISFLAIFSCFLPLCHRILPIVSPVFEIFKTPGMAIAIPAILVSPPLIVLYV